MGRSAPVPTVRKARLLPFAPMLISINWLNRYLNPPQVSAAQAEEALMDAGFPIETREPLPGGDTRIDVEVTSNRGDCLSHVGVAREVAAKTGRALVMPTWAEPTARGAVGESLQLQNTQPAVCPLFTARVIRGVKVGPSQAWLREALESVGQRSINNVVDVTNFITFELGQPCHVFDLQKLAGRSLVIRYAREGESLTTLDGKKRTLKADELVVADSERATSLAGVIGGADSEVDGSTTDVVFEMATWDPVTVRRAARRLGIRTDASYRFERIVDARTLDWGSRRGVAMICDVAGGTPCEGVLAQGKALADPLGVRFRPARCNAVMGIQVPVDEMVRLLTSVGIVVEPIGRSSEELRCVIPDWRPDLYREVDIIEEVARLKGLAAIPIAEKLAISAQSPQPHENAKREFGVLLTGMGFYETVTFSFVSHKQAAPFTIPGIATMDVCDDRRKAEPTLRPSVIPSLLACRRANQDGRVHVEGGVRLFEVASIFGQRADVKPGEGPGTVERRHLALLMDVPTKSAKVTFEDKQAGVRAMRGVIEAIVRVAAGRSAALVFTPTDMPWSAFEKGVFAGVALNGQNAGYVGLVSGALQGEYGLDVPLVASELNLDSLLACYPPRATVATPPEFPAIDRDLSVVVPEAVTWAQIEGELSRATLEHFERREFVGTYRGKQTGPGKKSVTMRLHFRDPGRTLRREEVEPQMASVVSLLNRAFGAEVRTGA